MSDFLVRGPRIQVTAPESSSRPTPILDAAQCAGTSRTRGHGSLRLPRLINGASNVLLTWQDGLSESEREERRRTEERKQILAARMQNARTLKEWETAAKELDRLEGNDEWKLDDSSGESEYRPDLIEARLRELDQARANNDVGAMMYLIRTALSRDVGGMGNADLYLHSYVGTKTLIERYVDSAIRTIESVVEKSVYQTDVPPRDLLEGMIYARQSFGRSALLLSGGATFGMSHVGVLKTLFEQNLLPRIISGASAGSIVCAVLCTRKDDEVPNLIKNFPTGDLGVFEGKDETLSDHIRNLLTKGSWSDIANLTRVMRSWLGDVTFLEAYNRTRRICNICVSSASIYEVPRLLNYVTAPNVLIWSAVAASCSVPLVFQGHPLLMKNPETGRHEPWIPTPQRFIDGSVENDLPMTRLAEMFNVNHFIVSQVNPHVVPFLAKDDQPGPGRVRQKRSTRRSEDWLNNLTSIAKEEGVHTMQFLAEMGFFPNLLTKLLSVMSQKYSGDITILPEFALSDLPLILKNPTPEFMMRNCLIGERATWPKLSRIRDRLAIELALDQAVHALRARVVFSRSQVDLRRSMGVGQPLSYGMSGGRGLGGAKGLSFCVPQPPGSGDMSPTDERVLARRRGSGASIQLVVARHRRPFEDDSDDDSDEDGRLELRYRPPRARVSRPANHPGLKRNARSHGYMRAGRPADFPRPRDEHSPALDELLMGAARSGGESSAAHADESATGEEDGSSVSPTMPSTSSGDAFSPPLNGEAEAPTSEGGLQSDAEPYQRRGHTREPDGPPAK